MTNTNTKKETKREVFTSIIKVLEQYGTEAQVKMMLHEIDLLNRKAQNKKTAVSKEAQENMNKIMEIMQKEPSRLFRCGEIAKMLDINIQKASPLLSKMANAEIIIKNTDKRVTTYQVKQG